MEKNETLQNLSILLGAMKQDHLGKADFTDAFKNVIAFIKKIEARNKKEFQDINKALTDFSNKLKDDNNTNVSELKDSTKNYVSGVISKLESEHAKLKEMVDKKLAEVVDGKDADEDRILENLKAQVHLPTIDELKDDLPKLGKQVRDSLELLDGEERLDVSAIKGLKELMQTKSLGSKVSGGGLNVGSMNLRFVDDESLVGTVNGTNKIFTTSKTPVPDSLKVYRGGARQRITEDYTFTGKTITFTTAPVSGEVLLCDYRI